MNDSIRQVKTEMLNRLKQFKQSVESQREVLFQKKYALKKTAVDEECIKLTEAFANYKREKLSACNADVAKKEQEVIERKQKLLDDARQLAQQEVIDEICALTAEYDSEIAKLEKELG